MSKTLDPGLGWCQDRTEQIASSLSVPTQSFGRMAQQGFFVFCFLFCGVGGVGIAGETEI